MYGRSSGAVWGDEAFRAEYEITALRTNKIYGYQELLSAALRWIHKSPLPVGGRSLGSLPKPMLRAYVEAAMSDHTFMRFRRGMIPQRVIEDIETRVWGDLCEEIPAP